MVVDFSKNNGEPVKIFSMEFLPTLESSKDDDDDDSGLDIKDQKETLQDRAFWEVNFQWNYPNQSEVER